MRSNLPFLLLCVLLGGLTALPQTSHRQLDPKPPRPPNPLEQLGQQAEEDAKERARQQTVSREAREAARAELEKDLSRLMEVAEGLQSRLKALDANRVFPADLSRQGEELDRLARQVHRRIRKL